MANRGVRVTATAITVGSICAIVAGFFLYAQGQYREMRQGHDYWSRSAPMSAVDPVIGYGPNRRAGGLIRVPGTDTFVPVAANPQGLRVPPDQAGMVMDAADVVAVGGSFTYGLGVTADQSYPAVAQRLSGLAVANAGFPGYGTTAALLSLDRLAALKPKIVVYGFIDRHLRRNVVSCALSFMPICLSQAHAAKTAAGYEIRFPDRDGAVAQLTDFVVAGLRQPHWLGDGVRGMAVVAGRAFRSVVETGWDLSDGNKEGALAFLLARMKEKTDAMGARLVVVRIPIEITPSHDRDRIPPTPAMVLRALPPGVDLLDAADALRALPPQVPLVAGPADNHPSAEAHGAIGAVLAAYLRANPAK